MKWVLSVLVILVFLAGWGSSNVTTYPAEVVKVVHATPDYPVNVLHTPNETLFVEGQLKETQTYRVVKTPTTHFVENGDTTLNVVHVKGSGYVQDWHESVVR